MECCDSRKPDNQYYENKSMPYLPSYVVFIAMFFLLFALFIASADLLKGSLYGEVVCIWGLNVPKWVLLFISAILTLYLNRCVQNLNIINVALKYKIDKFENIQREGSANFDCVNLPSSCFIHFCVTPRKGQGVRIPFIWTPKLLDAKISLDAVCKMDNIAFFINIDKLEVINFNFGNQETNKYISFSWDLDSIVHKIRNELEKRVPKNKIESVSVEDIYINLINTDYMFGSKSSVDAVLTCHHVKLLQNLLKDAIIKSKKIEQQDHCRYPK